MKFLLYILVSTVLLVSCRGQDAKSDYFALFPTRRTCTQRFDVRDYRCVSRVYCNGHLDLGWVDNSLNRKGYSCHNTYVFNGETLSEINYKFINMHNLDTLDNTYAQKIVSILDLSYNNFVYAPLIPTMIRLNMLNISRNELTVAKLYNERQLQSLSEIDLSHNKINQISINSNYYVFNQLKSINLSNNQLVVLENGIFDSFPKLETLDLSFNFIESLNILTFEGVKDLVYLNLKHNELSELSLSLIRFSKLQKLDLSINKIQSVKSADFEKLSKVTELYLGSNLIKNIEETALSKMTEIRIIVLSNNVIESLPTGTWEMLTKLVNIDLEKNNLKSLPVGLFKGKHITEFSVSENQLEGTLSTYMFKGLNLYDNLDLSNQELTSIEDFAFDGLENLKNLLLNRNQIHSVSKKSFSTLRRLEVLDLSNNMLTTIEFDIDDLVNLQSLLLQRNHLLEIKQNYFNGLNKLQFLDISSNNITTVESGSFKSLQDLINLQISNNCIRGVLEQQSFDGLHSLPELDISGTLLTTLANGSFNGMNELKKFNASHSQIYELQFDSFLNTGSLELIDLSYNRLTDFNVNTTDLKNLHTLMLSNNLLTKISSTSFKDLQFLKKITLANNKVEIVDDEAFAEQKSLTFLDLSYNKNMKLNIIQIEKIQSLDSVFLSGIITNITFQSIIKVKWSHLEMSYSNICNITSVALNNFENLNTLVLNNNNVTKVEVSAFQGIKNLKILDLSFNNISFIQSGAFKENTLLSFLNISHNMLKAVNYGIFRGLSYLNTVDMSFNEISDLQSERFYEVKSLRVLIVDHNRINNLLADEFSGTNIEKLSIGENPIPCHIFVNLKKTNPRFTITAIRLDDKSDDENVDGVTCNMDVSIEHTKHSSQKLPNNQVLEDLRDIIKNVSIDMNSREAEVGKNITRTIDENNYIVSTLLRNISSINTNTNDILSKLLSAINVFQKTDLNKPDVPKEEESGEFLNHQGATARIYYKDSENLDSITYVKVCVGLILVLVMLVSTILFLLYRSGFFFRNQRIMSRRLSEMIENSTL